MYESLGALSVPSWLKSVAGAVIRGTKVTVPTPAGPMVVDLGNKASVDAAKAAITGSRVGVTVGNQAPTPMERVNAAAEQVPGGWLTIAAVVAGAFLMLKGRRR